MALIDSRIKRNGRTVVTTDAAAIAEAKITDLSKRASNPLTWDRYSKDVDWSISGLGSTRRFKRYPGKTFSMAAAQWRDSPAEADAAAKAALKAKANEGKTKSGAATSL